MTTIKVSANGFHSEQATVDTEGRTAQQFADEMFEFEYCSECGKDADEHTAVIGPFGQWFAFCDSEAA